MENIKLIEHREGAPFLRLFGLGPKFIPVKAINQLQKLLEENTFWAKNRSEKQLKKMIANSCTVVTLWENNKLIGFGRSTSDKCFRAVLWDIVIANDHQNLGLGKMLIETLISSKSIKDAEKIYLMTTNCEKFYKDCGFIEPRNQTLLITNKCKY